MTTPLQPAAAALYGPLAGAVADAVGLGTPLLSNVPTVASRRILDELKVNPGKAFAEDNSLHDIRHHFVAPDVLNAAVDRATAIVVGAKGAGKTYLWRYLVNGGGGTYNLPPDMTYLVGHAPKAGPAEAGSLQLSPDALKEIEQNAQMKKRGTYKAFWVLYALARLASKKTAHRPEGPNPLGSQIRNEIVGAVTGTAHAPEVRKALRRLLDAAATEDLQTALKGLLDLPSAGTLAENALAAVDRALLEADRYVTLTYDGLDTGFETGNQSDWTERQARFIEALLQVVYVSRSRFRRLFFKVFLREDIYLSLSIQNKSHLEATKVELRWKPADVWRLSLNVASTSRTYNTEVIQKLQPGISSPWPVEQEKLKALLAPLWGETVERGKMAKTANYVQERTSDASERLFPRTLMQVLDAAVEDERSREAPPSSWRVIGFKSLQVGVAKASQQRVEDLKSEYGELEPYLEALENMEISGSRNQFVAHMKKYLLGQKGHKRTGRKRGAPRGALHAGPGGWDKVIERLEHVGVLGPYTRRKLESGETRLAVALLYREGLGIRRAGLA